MTSLYCWLITWFSTITAGNFCIMISILHFFGSFQLLFWSKHLLSNFSQILLKWHISFAWMISITSRICERPFLLILLFIYLKIILKFSRKSFFPFFGNFQLQFCSKDNSHFSFLLHSPKIFHFAWKNCVFLSISWKKPAKIAIFAPKGHLFLVWPRPIMDHIHDQGQKLFKDIEIKFNRLSDTFYYFEKSLDVVELCMFLYTEWLLIVRNRAISTYNNWK